MFCADAVMSAEQPSLKIGEYEMDDRQEIVGHFRIPAFGNGLVVVPALTQRIVAAPIVRDDERTWNNGALDKSTQRLGTSIWGDCQPHSPGVTAIPSLVLGGPWFAVTNFDSAGNKDLVMDTSAFTTGSATDIGFISLDMLVRFAADAILIRAHHTRTQLVENAKGRLVARQPELPLKLDGGYSRCMADDQIGRPKPNIQRCMAALHDGASHKTSLPTTLATFQYAGPRGDTERLCADTTEWANKRVAPAGTLQIGRASRVIWKKPLELGKRFRECKIATSMDIHIGHGVSRQLRSSVTRYEPPYRHSLGLVGV